MLTFAVTALALFGVTRPVRLPGNPIITPQSSPTIGSNINGPSLIRVPSWIKKPLGKYYLYFAHHGGKFIRLAYANKLNGPWTVYEPGSLQLEEVKTCYDHIASPDVHVDNHTRKIKMYFHCPAGQGSTDISEQKTFVAFSGDGLRFEPGHTPLGPAYFRVFYRGGYYYAVARGGTFFRSRNGMTPFEAGPVLLRDEHGRLLRHAAVHLHGDILDVYFSRIGDKPESILVSRITLSADWSRWAASVPQLVLRPETDYEGTSLPLEESKPDDAPRPVHQVRDPAIFQEGGRIYLLYSVAGENGIAIAELHSH